MSVLNNASASLYCMYHMSGLGASICAPRSSCLDNLHLSTAPQSLGPESWWPPGGALWRTFAPFRMNMKLRRNALSRLQLRMDMEQALAMWSTSRAACNAPARILHVHVSTDVVGVMPQREAGPA